MRRLLPIPCLLALPGAAHACAACAAAADRNRAVFYSTIALSLLPLILLGAAFLWLHRRSRARFRAQFGEHEAPSMAGGAAEQASRPRIAVVPVTGPRA